MKLIQAIGGFTLAAEGDADRAAVESFARYTSNIQLLEIGISDMSRLGVLGHIQRMHVGTRVAALINWSTKPMPLHAMRVGKDVCLGNDINPHEFFKALY